MPENQSPAKLAVMMQQSQTETIRHDSQSKVGTAAEAMQIEKVAHLALSIGEERIQRCDTESLRRLCLTNIFPCQLSVLDILLAHVCLEEAYDLVDRWSRHADNVGNALVHRDTFWDVLREVPILVVDLKATATLYLLHRTAEALVTVAGLDERRQSGRVLNLIAVDGLQIRLQVWDLIGATSSGLQLTD